MNAEYFETAARRKPTMKTIQISIEFLSTCLQDFVAASKSLLTNPKLRNTALRT